MEPINFRFVQVEAPWPLGPADGRYVVRGHAGEPTHVLVLSTLGAARRRRRRARSAAPEPEPTAVPIGRATLIDARPLEVDPKEWLHNADLESEALTGLSVINTVLQVQRVVAADPNAHGIAADQALVMRVGTGLGEQVAHGRWESAMDVNLVAARRKRQAILSPQERLASVLAGRDVAMACEELALRARADVNCERWREAALQLDCALRAALAELTSWAGQGDIDARIEELDSGAAAIRDAADTALIGGLSDVQIAATAATLGRLEAALRARAALIR
ncbi:MAG: hypothetical protein F2813_02910 [Actinobacteria bacterium]|nr:hypothetical protein [Actinomycetota bacterium]